MLDLVVSGLCFTAIPNTFHENECSARLQRGYRMAQHGLMLGHLVVCVDNQRGVKAIVWQLRIIRCTLDDLDIFQSFFAETLLQPVSERSQPIFWTTINLRKRMI